MDELTVNGDQKKPSFSIVLKVYNSVGFVEEAVRSMLEQDYDGQLEYIIVDDASTDGSAEVVKRIVDETDLPVKLVLLERNQGIAGATEAGWREATGDWIIMMDGDDVQLADRCSKTAHLIGRYPDAGMISMSTLMIDEQGEQWGVQGYGLEDYDHSPDVLCLRSVPERMANKTDPSLFGRVAGFGCAMAIKRSFVLQWGEMRKSPDKRIDFLHDMVWELRVALSAPILGSKEIACLYRSHANNVLNRKLSGAGREWIRQHEVFMSHYHCFEAASFRQMVRDVERAMHEKSLTDFKPDELVELHSALERHAATREMCADWWQIPWGKRVCRALHYWGTLTPQFRMWPWWRLLPLSLFCWLKSQRR